MSAPPRHLRPGSRHLGAVLATLIFAIPLAGLGCVSGEGSAALPRDPGAQAAEIERLEARIEEDRARLAGMVTTPRDYDAEPFADDTELRAIAERLSANAARLEALRAASTGSGDVR